MKTKTKKSNVEIRKKMRSHFFALYVPQAPIISHVNVFLLPLPMGGCFSSSAPVGSHSPPGPGTPPKPPTPDHAKILNNTTTTPTTVHLDLDLDQQQLPQNEQKNLPSPILKVFTMSELTSATRNFRPDTVLGVGGFGTVFKGWIDEKTLAPSRVGVGIPIAVKKSNPDSIQGIREWTAEVQVLGKLSHPNLVKLLGYCAEANKFMLVYEFMQKGSLESHLFRKGADPLSWETRLSIAIGAAQGLAFLHNTPNKFIYRDFKSSNILLDSDFQVKLSDFGLAKEGPVDGNTHVTTRVIGTRGYAAPEYIATGHLYVKSDVYCFGVVLLELLTGERVLDINRPPAQHNLVEWTMPIMRDKRKLMKIVDKRLENQYPAKAAIHQIAELISNCLECDPKNRPSMDEVLHVLQQIVTIKMNHPKQSKLRSKNQINDQDQHAAGPSSRAAGYRSPLPMSKPYF